MPTAAPISPPKPRARRWVRVLTALILLLLLLIAAAPAIIGKTPLLGILVRKALAGARGEVVVGSASLGWFSPIEIHDLSVTDLEKRPVATVSKLSLSKSLLSMLLSQSDLGEISLENPVVEVASEKGRTNVEEVFASYLETEASTTSSSRTSLRLKITKGRLLFRDRGRELTGLEASVSIPGESSQPISFVLSAVVPGPGVAGALKCEASLGASSEVKLDAARVPLEVLDPFLGRLDSSLSVAGLLTSKLTVTWTPGFATYRIEGVNRIEQLDLMASWLRGDRLKLTSLDLPLRVEATESTLKIENAALTCDLGRVSVLGEFSLAGDLRKYLDRPGVAVNADLDLAKLARALPKWTSLREGTDIRTGAVSLVLANKGTSLGTTWEGKLHASELRAVRGGKSLEWLEPLSIEFSGRFPGGGLPTIDTLICRSDIIAFQARGTPESFKAAANIYLDRLTARLGEFIDLDGITLDGQAVVRAEVTRSPATGAVTATASIDLTNFAYADAFGPRYREPKLNVRVNAAGVYHANSPIRIDSGSLTLTAAEDSLDLRLLEPVTDAARFSSGRISAKLSGSLSRWRSRVSGFATLPADWKIDGQGSASASIRVTEDQILAETLRCSFNQFLFHGEGVDIREPAIAAEGDIRVHRRSGGIEGMHLKLACASVTADSPRLAIEPLPTGDKAIVGSGTFQADLASLERWFGEVDPRKGGTLGGKAAGRFDLKGSNGVTEFDVLCDVKDFILGPKTAPTWKEPTLSIALEGGLDPARDEFRLRKSRLERVGLEIRADGSYTHLSTTQDVALQGTMSYDFAKLSPLLRNLIGGNFDATGRGSKPFKLLGSLMPRGAKVITVANITGDAGLNWQSLQAYGFDLGPAEITARLAQGKLTTNRIDAAFGGGSVHLTPTLRLDPEPMSLSVEKGTIVERARLTPKSTAGAIGYALPVVANAVQADGQISFTIAENNIPIADVTRATMKGSLFVHKASVGTGPIVAEIARLLGAASTSVSLANDMTVPIKVENGRVHHENLRLTVNGYAVTTRGSVGFDGSLSLEADVPIPAGTMFKNNPRLIQALSNKSIKVPIGGTLAKPMLDPKGFDNAIAQLVKDATKSVATDLIKGGLEKLLTPKK